MIIWILMRERERVLYLTVNMCTYVCIWSKPKSLPFKKQLKLSNFYKESSVRVAQYIKAAFIGGMGRSYARRLTVKRKYLNKFDRYTATTIRTTTGEKESARAGERGQNRGYWLGSACICICACCRRSTKQKHWPRVGQKENRENSTTQRVRAPQRASEREKERASGRTRVIMRRDATRRPSHTCDIGDKSWQWRIDRCVVLLSH